MTTDAPHASSTTHRDHDPETRRKRLERMARLARAYRGWSAGELGIALGRENTRIAPPSGVPKLDLVARLAEALDWDIGEVAARLWGARGDDAGGTERRGASFAELDERAQVEHRAGAYDEMERTACAMRARARSARERAIAANRLAGACDGLGQYQRVLEAVRGGLSERGIGADVRTMLTINLANASYTLWNLHETRAIAEGVLDRFAGEPPRSRLERVAQAFARALRGHARRRALETCDGEREFAACAAAAAGDLAEAARLFGELHDEFGDGQYAGLAHTARGGLLEARVAAGEREPFDALDEILSELDGFVDLDGVPSPHAIESAGWWSVFGANIAARAGEHGAAGMRERAGLEQALAVCSGKTAEVGEHLGNWSMRERAFSMEWRRRSDARGEGAGIEWTLDTEDLRALIGTMGRLPFFRPRGWAILDAAVLAT